MLIARFRLVVVRALQVRVLNMQEEYRGGHEINARIKLRLDDTLLPGEVVTESARAHCSYEVSMYRYSNFNVLAVKVRCTVQL